MPLVPAICPQCNGQIEVDNSNEAGICKHCGTPFITEKAINNYIIANATIQASTVNVYNTTVDYIVRGGVLEKYNGESRNVEIPTTVTIIGDEAFAGISGIVSVKIPDTVTKIGKRAFKDCTALQAIDIPESVVEIGEEAFCGSGLLSITIPKSVKLIDTGAFSKCTLLKSAVICKGVQELGNSAFQDCSNLESISLPDDLRFRLGPLAGSGLAYVENGTMYNYRCPTLGLGHFPGTAIFLGCNKLEKIDYPYWTEMLSVFLSTKPLRRRENLCQYCGFPFKLIGRICSNCGRKKDY